MKPRNTKVNIKLLIKLVIINSTQYLNWDRGLEVFVSQDAEDYGFES